MKDDEDRASALVEHCAKAMWAAWCAREDGDWLAWDDLGEGNREEQRRDARACLEAALNSSEIPNSSTCAKNTQVAPDEGIQELLIADLVVEAEHYEAQGIKRSGRLMRKAADALTSAHRERDEMRAALTTSQMQSVRLKSQVDALIAENGSLGRASLAQSNRIEELLEMLSAAQDRGFHAHRERDEMRTRIAELLATLSADNRRLEIDQLRFKLVELERERDEMRDHLEAACVVHPWPSDKHAEMSEAGKCPACEGMSYLRSISPPTATEGGG